MKAIKIRHFYRMHFVMKTILFFVLLLCLYFWCIGIKAGIIGLITIFSILLVLFAVGFGFFFSYGIKITDKRVTLISQSMLKTFCYDDVVYIKVIFENNGICGEIKPKQQKAYLFSFDQFDLNPKSFLLYFLFIVEPKITKSFVDKSISELSRCEKVTVINHYEHTKSLEK